MKIVIINPNSSKEMTQSIARVAEKFVNGRYQVEALATEGAPEFIDYPEDTIAAAPGMIQIVKEYENKVLTEDEEIKKIKYMESRSILI